MSLNFMLSSDQVYKSLCFDRDRKYTLSQNTLASILLAWPLIWVINRYDIRTGRNMGSDY